jgi:hypothetical protein
MCEAVKSVKYQTRKSPAYHAKDCKNQTRKGNDGKQYISRPDKRGVFKWMPKNPKSEKTYTILDNGGTPFVVEVTPSSLKVFQTDYDEVLGMSVIVKEVLTSPYKRLFVGDNLLKDKRAAKKGMYPGNSLLFELAKGSDLYVGSEIFQFQTRNKEEIHTYMSPVGNSSVPYPYAVGTTHTYFMLEYVAVSNSLLDLKKDAYEQLYSELGKDVQEPFRYKVVQKRLL